MNKYYFSNNDELLNTFDLGKLKSGIASHDVYGENFPVIYYLSGSPEIESFLNHTPMWEQKVCVIFYYYENDYFAFYFYRKNEKFVLVIKKDEILEIQILKGMRNGYQRTKSFVNAYLKAGKAGLLGMIAGNAKINYEKAKFERTEGLIINFKSKIDDSVLEFFCPGEYWKEVMMYLYQNLPSLVKNENMSK